MGKAQGALCTPDVMLKLLQYLVPSPLRLQFNDKMWTGQVSRYCSSHAEGLRRRAIPVGVDAMLLGGRSVVPKGQHRRRHVGDVSDFCMYYLPRVE